MKDLERFKNLTEIKKYKLILLLNSLKKINVKTLFLDNGIRFYNLTLKNSNFNFNILNFENNILKLAFKNKDIEIENLKFIEIENLATNDFKSISYKILNTYTYLKITI